MRHPIAKHSDRLARLACLHLVFLTASGWAADCSIDSTDIDRGQRKPFFICGDSVTPDYELTGLTEANVTLSYDQYLKRCAVGDNRRGIFFWLQAEADAKTTSLGVRNAQGDSLCDPVTLTVPERKLTGLARLTAATRSNSNIHLLTIEAGQGQNFSAACAGGISFPGWGRRPSRWPNLRLLSDGEMGEVPSDLRRQPAPLNCTGEKISALVRIAGQQREAAKIVIATVQLASGETVEGVAYARLPDPAWANSMPDEHGKFIDVDGIRTHYWEKGSGPALLLVHGGQPTGKDGGALTWLRNFDGLAERFHVYALDRLGQGLTDNPQSREDYAHYYERVAEHVWGFINAVGIDKVAMVGHSQGGWPVSRLALDHPDRVSCLVNVDGVLAPGSDLNLHTSRFYLHTIQFHPTGGATFESMKRTREFQSHTLNNIADFAVQRGYDLAQLPKLEEATVMMKELRMNPRHPAAQALFEQARQDIAAGMLKVPSLVIWGYNDPSSPYSGGLALFELINKATPISQLHVFANSGHESHIEYPEQFNQVVTNFCSQRK
jgi:2-hydroxy-6-oxo-6-(2'-carboxyphenyl)-hexa-2,4-dienoate hydrolase